MNFKKQIIIPFLILLYFFVHYITDFFLFINPGKSFFQVLLYLLVTGFLFIAGYKIFKNKERFTLIFSTLLFLFLFFGSFIDMAGSLFFKGSPILVDTKILIAFFLLVVMVIIICKRFNPDLTKKLLKFWFIYCLVLLCYDITIFFLSDQKEKKYLNSRTQTAHFSVTEKPSVFFLLFDMYPSDLILHKYLKYDNSELNSFLTQKGFFVTGNARSLYEQTYYSLSSTLNLKPLAYLNDSSVKDYKKKLIALKNIEQPDMLNLFERSGYIVRNYSVFNLQGQPSLLQFNLNYHLNNILTSSTFFNRFYDNFEADFFLAARRIDLGYLKKSWSNNIKSDLTTLRTNFNHLVNNSDNTTQPSFNYFHFMIPHPPILYDSLGRENRVKDMYSYNGFNKTIANYTGYIRYGNNEIKKMVDKIFEKYGKKVIIIIQGDHGYRHFPERFPDEVRHGILNAVYLYNKNYTGLNDSMTPIHTFKQVLKNQFNFDYDKQNE
jgi:hypothetical protein